ncbi:MAG: hypothetical protein J6S61_00190 [Elusimicrobiaceae bacterium]|nr:hypothetical protein [Elusimicrobiaceae bacterium]
MKTQKIVLALALVAVTPAVLSAQDYVGGPGSKMSYIADNALARIRKNHQENNQNQDKQEPVQNKQHDTTSIYASVPAYYPYGGREGHMTVQDDVHKNKSSRPKKDTVKYKPTGSYHFTSPEGHRAALGNAAWEARHEKRDSTSVPTLVRDIDTVSKNHQVTLDSKKADKSAKQTNKTFRDSLGEYGKQVLEAFQNNANAGK